MRKLTLFVLLTAIATPVAAQRPSSLSNQVRQYVTTDASIIAITGAIVIDGTGAPARENQTIRHRKRPRKRRGR